MTLRWPRLRSPAIAALLFGCSAPTANGSATTTAETEQPVVHHHHHHHRADGGVAGDMASAQPSDTAAAPVSDGQSAPLATGTADTSAPQNADTTTQAMPADGAGNPGLALPPSTGTPQTVAAFGTPSAVAPVAAPTVSPRWSSENGIERLICDGNEAHAQTRCPQCPEAPTNAAIVRAFLPAEQPVLRCEPPANDRGRLPMRATFNAAGYPVEVRFPGVHLSRRVGNCVGPALCAMHVPTFQSPASTVDYEYIVMLPDTTP